MTPPGLSLISIGLYDERDLSTRALEEARKCERLYVELYTTKLDTTLEKLSELVGKTVSKLPRKRLEENLHELIDEASLHKVGVLVGGDCLTATTHIALLLEARKKGISTKVVHGSSIFTAIAATGLSLYKFGKTVTLPFLDRGPADSVLEALSENMRHGLHTLILLDLDLEADRCLTIKDAVGMLLRSERPEIFVEDTIIFGVARLGSDEPIIRAGRASKIAKIDFGAPPQVIVVPGSLHFLESEALKVIGEYSGDALDVNSIGGEVDELVEKYVRSCFAVLEDLRFGELPKEVARAEVKNLIEHAERYLRDAMYYAPERKATALASVCYSEGVLDALRLLGLLDFEWR